MGWFTEGELAEFAEGLDMRGEGKEVRSDNAWTFGWRKWEHGGALDKAGRRVER